MNTHYPIGDLGKAHLIYRICLFISLAINLISTPSLLLNQKYSEVVFVFIFLSLFSLAMYIAMTFLEKDISLSSEGIIRHFRNKTKLIPWSEIAEAEYVDTARFRGIHIYGENRKFIGGYGSGLFKYDSKEIVKAINSVTKNRDPAHQNHLAPESTLLQLVQLAEKSHART